MIYLEFFIFLTAALGLIHILVHAPITEWFRNLVIGSFGLFGQKKLGEYFIHCPPCVGVWVGAFMTWIFMCGWILYAMPLSVSFFALLAQLYWFPED